MWRWQNHYAQKSQFEWNGFLSDRKDIPEVANNCSQLYRQLIGILMDDGAQLQPDPMEAMLQYQSAQQRRGSLNEMELFQKQDWMDVYEKVLATLFGQLRPDTARVAKRYATEQSLRYGISQELTYSFKAPLNNSAQRRVSAVECFWQGVDCSEWRVLYDTTTPLKRSAAHALRGLLKTSSPLLPRFDVTHDAFNIVPSAWRLDLNVFRKPKRALNYSEVP